jgi:predicted acyltransferase
MSIATEHQPARPATLPRRGGPPAPSDPPGTGLSPDLRPDAPALAEELKGPAAERLVSLDAYRGLVMVLMVSAGLYIPRVVKTFEETPELRHLNTPVWRWLAFHTDHVPWVGCSLWDLIQPSFMFMVGASLPFSIAARRAKGQSFRRMLLHAVVRSAVLVLLGIFLISNSGRLSRTDWTFTNVLTQIGLGYTFLFLIAWLRPRWQLAAAGGILLAYWAFFAAAPAPAPDADISKAVASADWQRLEGFAAHWEKNTNPAARFDQWFLNLFPRPDNKPYEYNSGGYTTLNFVPSLATMIFGLLAGELVRGRRLTAGRKIGSMLALGAAGLLAGWLLGWLGVCPVVKRIWTPSWTIYSTGWAFLFLAVFYAVIDVAKYRAWALPLVVVGMNSIAVYCMSMMLKPWVNGTVRRHAGQGYFDPYGALGAAFVPMLEATVFLLFCWAVAWWMYRRKIFLRI